MVMLIWLSLLAALLLLFLLPFVFAQILVVSLAKLHLSGASALLLVIAVILGGFVNLPVKRIPRVALHPAHPLAAYGFRDLWPDMRRVRRDTVIAVNVGGCLIPVALAVYEAACLLDAGPRLLGAAGLAAAVNIAICYVLARPVRGLGIALPSLVPALAAAVLAMLLAPDQAPPTAFIAGVAGPLVGADLLHLRDVNKIAAGVVSIGGAGTFDGIVLSGIIAAYLS
jgi:uncharacterized membrane protein